MSESEPSDYEEADDIATDKLTTSDVDRIRLQLSDKCSVVSAYLLSSKEPVDKRRMIENTLQDLLNAFNQISASYLKISATNHTVNLLKKALTKTIKDEVAAAVQNVLPPPSTTMTYAGVAAKISAKQDAMKVRVTNGPTVLVPNTVSVVIGPKTSSAPLFTTSDDTRKAIMKAVKPVDVNMRVNKVVNIRNNSVRIIADSLDVPKLKSCPALEAAGLEVKERERLNPRLVIRDVPTDISNPDLVADIVSYNLDADNKDSIKIVYRYPSRLKNGLASVIIETNSIARRILLNKGRICLAWHSCKVEDYLRVLQCYKCQDFGHLAKNCTASAVCGHCAGAHDSSSCSAGATSFKCKNCLASKLENVSHKAFDATKCPIIKRRLTEKAKYISY